MTAFEPLQNDLLLRTIKGMIERLLSLNETGPEQNCPGERVERPPIWVMRQGKSLKQTTSKSSN